MKFAIIAAGEGSRLLAEGVGVPKPLVEINGETLIGRLIRIFSINNATEIVVIVNDRTNQVQDYLRNLSTLIPLRVVVKNTPSSMHSFAEIAPYLMGERFCLTTVDALFSEEEFTGYINYFSTSSADGVMAVTDYVDDETPLYVTTNQQDHITGFFDNLTDATASSIPPSSKCKYISGGIYCLTPSTLKILEHCMHTGQSRMRNFQRQLVADGLQLIAYPFSKIIDIDHQQDIETAQDFIRTNR